MRHGLSDVTRVAQHTLWDDPPEVTSYILPNPALTLYRPLYDQAVVEALLDSRHGPEAVNVQHQMGRTALWWALARRAPGHMEVVRLLTYHKADADQPDMFGVTPRSLAKGKCLAILKVSEAGRARTIVHHGASAATAVKPLPPPPRHHRTPAHARESSQVVRSMGVNVHGVAGVGARLLAVEGPPDPGRSAGALFIGQRASSPPPCAPSRAVGGLGLFPPRPVPAHDATRARQGANPPAEGSGP
jgi:hypothetical protein